MQSILHVTIDTPPKRGKKKPVSFGVPYVAWTSGDGQLRLVGRIPPGRPGLAPTRDVFYVLERSTGQDALGAPRWEEAHVDDISKWVVRQLLVEIVAACGNDVMIEGERPRTHSITIR